MKTISIIALTAAALSIAACNQVDRGEVTSCIYNLEQNKKVCDLKTEERKDLIEDQMETRMKMEKIVVINNQQYTERDDGTFVPVK